MCIGWRRCSPAVALELGQRQSCIVASCGVAVLDSAALAFELGQHRTAVREMIVPI
jgi:hypothetical protein